MLGQGCDVDAIAAEMRARWGFGIRAAYRYANGLTLDQAAERFNAAANDSEARTTGARVSDWEGWPQTGRRPSAFNLVVLARAYGTAARRLIAPDEWDGLDERERLILDELNHQPADGQGALESGIVVAHGRADVVAAVEEHDERQDASALAADAAKAALDFATWAEASNVSSGTLDHLAYELGRIATNYVHAPLVPLFRDLTELRGIAFDLLKNGRQHPSQARELFFLAGTSCVLLAHGAQNLGDSHSAMAQVRAALTCAEQADHDGLRAWTHGTAALIAEWTHQHRRALDFAERGQQFAVTADSRVRLASLEARVAARAGHRDRAMAALERALHARDTASVGDELEEFGGLLTFPIVKQRYYAGSAYALLGEAEQAEGNALWAIEQYETGLPEERSYGDEAIARVDVCTARLTLGDLEGAQEALRPVLDLPAERRIEQLAVGLGRVRSALTNPRYTRVHIARNLTQEIDQFKAEAMSRKLLKDR
ncbi:XRE family transcriptional regulator [Amycolatopsis suaedae]|uniref:XRE family transcriptional regulator n=1 Tax=Amycolatopsis suaedae TaxID=2510978 RepID=A0A4Q7JDB7_9PSEU|nr:XRE family transcriptional regulator [Amycolatopsis suaedae]RZQ64364.1 XRE family transcriptional regulator [Amycolatopsis suaedae]